MKVSPFIFVFVYNSQGRNQDKRNLLRVRSWWELKGLGYHSHLSGFFLAFLAFSLAPYLIFMFC